MIKQKFQDILTTEMDRKEFLQKAGVAMLGIAGISTISKTLISSFSKNSSKSGGYGSSPYGR